jgi:WhiB family transcriptional regulator, redox-sensing transcriptional regulator
MEGGRRIDVPAPWVARAACQGQDPDDWMDDRPGRPTAAARAVCAACPVRAACLAHAMARDEPWGMWGGLTTRERLARRRCQPVRPGEDPARPYMGVRGPRKTKPPSSPKPRKVFSEELQQRAVQRYFESGHSIRDVAKELGVDRECLRRWVAAAREDEAS